MTPENGKPAEAPRAPRHRSPKYPGISLKTASRKIAGWFASDGLVAANKDAVIKKMGRDPGRLPSALKSFGLISEEDGQIKLTQRGLEIAARSPDDPKRKKALKDAALSPPIYRDLVGSYPGGLPSDLTLRSELITEMNFNEKYVDGFIKDFRATLEVAGISAQEGIESASFKQDVFSMGDGEITVRWPTALSPESFEDFSAWLDILKRKIARSAVNTSDKMGETPLTMMKND